MYWLVCIDYIRSRLWGMRAELGIVLPDLRFSQTGYFASLE